MIRVFFTYILPLVLPTLIYVMWIWYSRRKKMHNSNDDSKLPILDHKNLFWSLALGILMMIFALITIAIMTGDPPNSGTYQSPRFEDGKIIAPSYKKN